MMHLLPALLFACDPVEPSAITPPSDPAPSPVSAPTAEVGVRYVVRFPDPAQHRVEVEATVQAEGPTTWMMPVWTPGSYLVREYARQLESISATGADGAPVAVRKVAKNRWEVAGAGPTTVRWTLHAFEPSVRDNLVDADLAVLNGAATFLVPVDRLDRPLEVRMELPAAWSGVETALPPHPDGRPAHWIAPDYDTLVDSPILAGDLVVRDVVVEEVPHRLVHAGVVDRWDADRAAEDVARLAAAQIRFWGGAPYDRFLFLHVVGYGRGGLEHRDSTLLMTNEVDARDEEAWTRFLGLVSHELFHAWNVKRLRPEGLGPFDYEREVLTPSLWVAEGLTAYYDDLMLVRSGLLSEAKWLERMAEQARDALERPGRRVQPLSAASTDAWIKHYRPDAHMRNQTVSYYTKGAVVGWLLDAEIRRATDDRASLDDLLRHLWARHADARGYTPDDVRAAAQAVAGVDLGPRFDAWVDGTDELDLDVAFRWFGVRWTEPEAERGPPKGDLGVKVDGRGVVTEVPRDTPGWRAGVEVGDELLALDAVRLMPDRLAAEIARRPPGTSARLMVTRRGRVRELGVVLGEAPRATWKLELDPAAPTSAVLHRRRWWGTPVSAR